MNKLIAISLACLALTLNGSALAFDTSAPILCASLKVHECVDGAGCREVLAEEVSAPTFFRLDLEEKTIKVLKSGKLNKAENYEEIDGRIVLQGVYDGQQDEVDSNAWTVMLEEDTGRLVVTAATRQAAVIIFGACTEI